MLNILNFNQNEFFIIIPLLVILWGYSIFLSSKQAKRYKAKIKEFASLRRNGFVGSGLSQNKRKTKVKAIVILLVDPEGNIEKCEYFSGLSVFTRYKSWESVIGINIACMDAISACVPKRNSKNITIAVENAIKVINQTRMERDKKQVECEEFHAAL